MFPEASPSDPQGVRYLGEPHVVEVVDGHLLGMARHEEQPYVEGCHTGRSLRARGEYWVGWVTDGVARVTPRCLVATAAFRILSADSKTKAAE